MRKKFVPIKSGDIIYLSASVPSRNPPTSIQSNEYQTIYVSSTGPLNNNVGGVEVNAGCEIDDIYWCLFRVWHADAYSDWHVDNRRPRACVGEHGSYKFTDTVEDAEEEEADKSASQQREISGEAQNSKSDEMNENTTIDMIHGSEGRRVIAYENDIVFEHVATGQVLASLNDVNSLIDQEATRVGLVDRVIASQGRLKNMSKKQKKQQDTHFCIAPRFKSRAGVVYDGDLVRVTTFSTQGRLHVSGPHGVMDPLAPNRVREANVSHYHKIVDSGEPDKVASSTRETTISKDRSLVSSGNGEEQKSGESHRGNLSKSHSHLCHQQAKPNTSQGESVMTIKRFSQWTIPASVLNYGDCIRISNPEVDAYLWCSASTRGNKSPFFRRIRHNSGDYEGDHEVSKVVTGCKSIFMVERINHQTGGPVRWNDTVRFRHLVTGKYLVVNNSPIIDPEDSEGGATGRHRPFRRKVTGPKRSKAKDFQLALYDFKSADSNAADNEELFMGSLFNLNPVSAPTDTDGISKASSLAFSSFVSSNNCFAVISHSFVDTYNSDESSEDEDGGLFSSIGTNMPSGTQRCFLHANTHKVRHHRKKHLRDLFDASSFRGEVWGYEKGEGGNTAEANRPKGDIEATFLDRFTPRDAVKIETVEWNEVQAVMFALNAKNIAETYMVRVFKFANRQREGKDTAFTQDFVAPVLEMLTMVRKFAAGEPIFANETKNDESIDKSMRDLVVIDRRYLATCIIQGTKLLDTLFAMLAAPRHAGLLMDHIQREEKLSTVHREVGRTIAIATEDQRTQIYCAMQAYEEGPKAGLSFIGELVKQMHWNMGASSLLDMIVTNNKVLVRELVDERLIDFFLRSLCKRGPSRQTLDFLTSINICMTSAKGTEPVVSCQETLCRLLFPTFGYHSHSNLGERRFNRRSILLESALGVIEDERIDNNSRRSSGLNGPHAWSPHRNRRISYQPQANGYQIVISWEGLDDYRPGSEDSEKNHALFYSARKLGMKFLLEGEKEHKWHIDPQSWNEYKRTFFHHEKLPPRQWVKLSEFIWTIDPIAKHGIENWAKISARLENDETAKTRFNRAQALANYYMGILNLFTNMCKYRSVRVIKHLEKQFSYELLIAGLADKNLPDLTRASFANLLLALYIDRYPHETILLPRVVRPYFSSVHKSENEGSLVSCDDMLPRFNTDEGNAFAHSASIMEPQSFDEDEEEIVLAPVGLSNEEEENIARIRLSSKGGSVDSSSSPGRKHPGASAASFAMPRKTIMQDVSNDKFENLQGVIIRILKSCEMEDQLPKPKTKAEAKQVADRMKFTHSVLGIAKKILFSGFFVHTDRIQELTNVVVRFMRKPEAARMADGVGSSAIAVADINAKNILGGVGKGLGSVGGTALGGLGKVGKLFAKAADGGDGQGEGEGGTEQTASPKYDSNGRRTNSGDGVEMVENPAKSAMDGIRKKLKFKGLKQEENGKVSRTAKRFTTIVRSQIESSSHLKAEKLIQGLSTEEGRQRAMDKLGSDLFKFLESFDNKVEKRKEVTDEIYERQRQNALGKWSANHLVGKEAKKIEVPSHMEILYFKIGDKIHKAEKDWSPEEKSKHPHKNIGGLTPLLCSKSNPEVDLLPEAEGLWEYKEDTWMLNKEVEGVVSKDNHNWCYNFNWPGDGADLFGRPRWWAKYHATAFVRIRKWIRTRQLTSAVNLALKYAFKLDKVTISNAFRKSAMGKNNKGKVDLTIAADLMAKALKKKLHDSQGVDKTSNEQGLASDGGGGNVGDFVSSVHSEAERAREDTVKCRQLTCDMLTYAAGAALDVRITAVAARLRRAIDEKAELYTDGKGSRKTVSERISDTKWSSTKSSRKTRSSLRTSTSALPPAPPIQLAGVKRVDSSIAGTNKSRDAIVHSMLLKHKWEKSKEPVTLTMAGMNLFDSLFKRGSSDGHLSRLDIGDPQDTETARDLLSALLTERDGDLAEKILCTLFIHHSRKSLLVHRLSEMHWLMDDESMHLHHKLLENLAVLRNNVQSFFSWGSSTPHDGEEHADDVEDQRRGSKEERRTSIHSTDGQAFTMQSQRTLDETLMIIKEFTDACYKTTSQKRKGSLTETMNLIHKEASAFTHHKGKDQTDAHIGSVYANIKPAKGRQTMMRKLEVHMIFIELLEVEAEVGDTNGQQDALLKLLQTAANDFMVAFMDDNTENKLEVIRCGAIGIFLKHVGKARGVSRVLASIYKNSAGLVRDVPKSILIDFASHIQNWGVDLRNLFFYMDFFRNVMVVKGVPMRRNQGMVMNVFTDPNYSNILVTYCSTGTGGEDAVEQSSAKGRDRTGTIGGSGSGGHLFLSGPAMKRKHLLRDFADREESSPDNECRRSFENILLSQTVSKGMSSRMTNAERQMYWHARVVELLGLCCTGNVDSTELSASRVISFSEIFSFFSDPEYWQEAPFLWTAFAKFTGNVYFDTDVSSDLSSEGRMSDMTTAWEVVLLISEAMEAYVEEYVELVGVKEEDENDDFFVEKKGKKKGKNDKKTATTREDVLVEAIIEGGFASVEAFYRCVVQNYSVLERGSTMGTKESSNFAYSREKYAGRATVALQGALGLMIQKRIVRHLKDDHKKILSSSCLVLGIYPEEILDGTPESPVRESDMDRSESVNDTHRSFGKGRSFFSSERGISGSNSPGSPKVGRASPPLSALIDENEHWEKKEARKVKREYAWGVQSSEYINLQMVNEFNDLVTLVLKFGTKQGKKNSTTEGKRAKRKGKTRGKKVKAIKIDDVSFETNKYFDALIQRLIEHVRRLVAGLVKGLAKYNMTSGEDNAGLMTNCLLGFRSSAPLVLRLLRNCISKAGIMWEDDNLFVDAERKRIVDEKK